MTPKRHGIDTSNLVAIIGRGNSGTRLLSYTLYASGVYLGAQLNHCGDSMPPEKMYAACRVFSKHVRRTGDFSWNFAELSREEPGPKFIRHCFDYLAETLTKELAYPRQLRGWKLPETTLVFPWITQLLPDAKYIHIVRDPRNAVESWHLTDDLRTWGIPSPYTKDIRQERAISWLYQYNIVRETPKPRNFIQIRFEDFILDQERTLKSLERFLGIPLARIPVRKDPLQRYSASKPFQFGFLADAMRELEYAR